MRRTRPGFSVASLLCLSLLASACGSDSGSGGDAAEKTPSPRSTPTANATVAAEGGVIDGKFDVGGHELYVNCAGSGEPTIVYLHGAITESSVDPHSNATAIQNELSGEHRVCLYDRRNLGHSDTVDAPQRPADAISDLEMLLAAAEVKPPYVLLGASFGGLLSYLYMSEHPDDVVGMVLLDSPIPDELSLEHLVPAKDRYKALDEEDEKESLERISHYRVFKAAAKHIGKEPDIPVTFLASTQEPPSDVNAEYDRKYLRLRAEYVDRFSPGKLVEVDAPHFMEPAIPKQIADALRAVIKATG